MNESPEATTLHLQRSVSFSFPFPFPQNSDLPMFLIFRAIGGIRRVQIPRDICPRFGRFLYSTKLSWIIKEVILLFNSVVSFSVRDDICCILKIKPFLSKNRKLSNNTIKCLCKLCYSRSKPEGLQGIF